MGGLIKEDPGSAQNCAQDLWSRCEVSHPRSVVDPRGGLSYDAPTQGVQVWADSGVGDTADFSMDSENPG